MKPTKKRRIILIDNRFQLRMAAAFIALQILLTGLFATGLYLFMDSEVHAGLSSAHASYQSLSQMLLPIVSILAIFSVTLSIVLTTVFVILISHKIAGPVYRFNAVLESLSQRRLETATKIRPGDQFGELANTLEKAVNVISSDVTTVKSLLEKLRVSQTLGDAHAVESEIKQIEIIVNQWKKNERRSS
ncbi:MAG: hypothetical protein ABL859_06775 [Methylotenera sp.]|uniref:hypothetical protein n=1 Tax=Methylotenera sp. TaxID=2051956 RepID=UPI00179A081F|nr:hypothetical protein [Methylotenera sp.]NOU24448.1 hypothetical protein [Methylotenera sp.]